MDRGTLWILGSQRVRHDWVTRWFDCIYIPTFIYLFIPLDRHSVCFHPLDSVNNNVMNINITAHSLSCVWFSVTPWTIARQPPLSITNSQSLLKLMSIESRIPSNHLIFCHPFSSYLQSCPASRSFPVSWLFTPGGQSTGTSASASVLPMNIQDWFPLG